MLPSEPRRLILKDFTIRTQHDHAWGLFMSLGNMAPACCSRFALPTMAAWVPAGAEHTLTCAQVQSLRPCLRQNALSDCQTLRLGNAVPHI